MTKVSKNPSFTVWLKIDYYDSPEEDALLAKEKDPLRVTQPGSYWTYSVGDVVDADKRILNKQSVLQIDVPCKNGGLKWLLKDLLSRLPRFLDENGLRST